MPIIKEVFVNNNTYPDPTYVSEWINLESSSYTVFTVFCSENCSLQINWAVDDQYQVIDSDSVNLIGGDTEEIVSLTKTRFVQYTVISIASNPCTLRLQAFFWQRAVGVGLFQNIGNGARVLVEPNRFRTFISSDNSVTITENAEEIDLVAGGGNITLSSAGGTFSLVNDGVGPALANKGITAGTDISIVDSGTDLTINSAVANTTLTSAGGTFSLVNDGTGPTLANKGITAGTDITIVDSGTDLTINSTAVGSTIWQQFGSTISPVTVSTLGLLCGDRATNTVIGLRSTVIGGNTNAVSGRDCSVVGGANNSCSGVGGFTLRNSIVGGNANTIIGGAGGAGETINATIIGGDTNTINRMENGIILGGNTNSIIHTGTGGPANCFVLGGSNNFVSPGLSSGIVGGDNNFLDSQPNNFLNRSVILGGLDNTIVGGAGGAGSTENSGILLSNNSTLEKYQESVIVGGSNHTLVNTTANTSQTGNFILGGQGHDMTGTTLTRSGIIGGNNSDISASINDAIILGGQGHTINAGNNATIIGGSNGTASHSNSWLFTHGAPLSTTANNTFTVKNTGGSTFYSNAPATTGVELTSGSSSWAAVSDVNKKENLMEVDYQDVMNKVLTMPVYKYNFIGNNPEKKCIGPIAQDWNDLSRFGCSNIQVPVMEPVLIPLLDDNGDPVLDGNGDPVLVNDVDEYGDDKMVQSVDGNGDPIFTSERAKNPLTIEMMDGLGVCLSCIKNLDQRVTQNQSTSQKIVSDTVNFTTFFGRGFESNSRYWRDAGSLAYKGTNNDAPIQSVVFIGYTSRNTTYYKFRLFDETNVNVIAESNVGNSTNDQILEVNTINNLPTEMSLLRVQILATDATGNTGINGRKRVGIKSMMIYK